MAKDEVRGSTLGRVFGRAAEDHDFRRRLLANSGSALAEEGFLLTDQEMGLFRDQWETVCGLSERGAYEKVMALAHGYRR